MLSLIQRLQALLHVVDKDHHVVKALHPIVRHLAAEHLPSQQRRRTPRLHRQLHIPPQQTFRVLTIESQRRSRSSPLYHHLMPCFSSPYHRKNHKSCTHRAPPIDPTATSQRETRANRGFRPPACFPRGAGNSASRFEQPRQYTSAAASLRSQSAPHPSHTFKFTRKYFIFVPFQGVVLPRRPQCFSTVEWARSGCYEMP